MPKPSQVVIIIAIILSAFLIKLIARENKHIGVTRYDYISEKVPAEFNNFKITHLSDLHNDTFGENNEVLLSVLRAENPDIIVITGDSIDNSNHTDISTGVRNIAAIAKVAPTYVISGNHDDGLEKQGEPIMRLISEAGARVLSDETEEIRIGGAKILLAGISDVWLSEKVPADITGSRIKGLIYDGPALSVLLAHRPHLLDIYAAADADLTLTGHAHGGQFRLPLIGGLYAPNQGLFPKYTEGVFKQSGSTMIVSRGLGNSGFPFRLNNNPEVIIITLKSA